MSEKAMIEKEIYKRFMAGYLIWVLGLLLLTSCGSRKMETVSLPADFKGPKELGRIYGVKITEYDNIFLYNEGARWMGVPHRLGGQTKKGIDCSGFVTIVYREVYHKRLSRSSAEMLKKGGTAWIVANRHLPYEAELDAAFKRVRMVVDQGGYKVFEAVK